MFRVLNDYCTNAVRFALTKVRAITAVVDPGSFRPIDRTTNASRNNKTRLRETLNRVQDKHSLEINSHNLIPKRVSRPETQTKVT